MKKRFIRVGDDHARRQKSRRLELEVGNHEKAFPERMPCRNHPVMREHTLAYDIGRGDACEQGHNHGPVPADVQNRDVLTFL